MRWYCILAASGLALIALWFGFQPREMKSASSRPRVAATGSGVKAPAASKAQNPVAAQAHPSPSVPAQAASAPGAPVSAARLQNPPEIVRAVYLTSWSAGIRSRVDYLVDLHKTTDINAAVFDIKDYSGYVAYRMAAPQPAKYGAVRVTVRDINALVSRLHNEGIYLIARITVFQDPVLARARPDLAIHRQSLLPAGEHVVLSRDSLWLDRKGLAWIDPASHEAWQYIVEIAKDAADHGFDEINFDYVRFPSDGNLKDMYFPSWDHKTPKHTVLKEFFAYLRKQLPGTKLSADLFGLATVNGDDLGIGQVIEDAVRGLRCSLSHGLPIAFRAKIPRLPESGRSPVRGSKLLDAPCGRAVGSLQRSACSGRSEGRTQSGFKSRPPSGYGNSGYCSKAG